MHVASYVWDWGAHPPTQGQGWVLEAKALTDLLTPSITFTLEQTPSCTRLFFPLAFAPLLR